MHSAVGVLRAQRFICTLCCVLPCVQITQENGPAVLITVLNTQHVPQVLDTLEGSAAADRALAEGVVGGQYVQQMLAQLHKLEAAFNAAAAAGANTQAAGKAGAGRPGRAAAAAASAGRKRVRFAASAGEGEEGDTTDEEEYGPQDSEDGAHTEEVQRSHTPQSSKQQAQHSQQAQKLYSAAVANWASSSNLQAQQHQQQQDQPQPVSGAPTGTPDPAPVPIDPAAAAQAATYQFLDCLPERRVLWRLLLKGSVCAAPVQELQQLQQQLQAGSSQQAPVLPGGGADPLASAGALGSLLSVYAATAFASSPHAPTCGGGSSSGGAGAGATGSISGPAAAGGASTALQSLQSFQSRLLSSKGASLLRQVSRQLHKKREGYVRTVGAAIISADAAASSLAVRAAEASAAAARAAAQGGEGAEESAAAAQAAAAAAAAHVNIPRLLQGLPVAAVAAAAEAARLRVELCRCVQMATQSPSCQPCLFSYQVLSSDKPCHLASLLNSPSSVCPSIV